MIAVLIGIPGVAGSDLKEVLINPPYHHISMDDFFWGRRNGQRSPVTKGASAQISCSKPLCKPSRMPLSPAPLLRLNSIGEVTGVGTSSTQQSLTERFISPHQNVPERNLNKFRLSKSFSLPEVLHNPNPSLEAPKCRRPSLSSSFDSSLFQQYGFQELETKLRNCGLHVQDNVVPHLVKNLFLEAMKTTEKDFFTNKNLAIVDILSLKENVKCKSSIPKENNSYCIKDYKNKKLKLCDISCQNCAEVSSQQSKFCNLSNHTDTVANEVDHLNNLTSAVNNYNALNSSQLSTSVCDQVLPLNMLPSKYCSSSKLESTLENKNSDEYVGHCEESVHLDNGSRFCDNQDLKSSVERRVDLSAVLFQRKNCTKKGRPSCRKRNKRQREKERCKSSLQDSSSVSMDSFHSPEPTTIFTSSPKISSAETVFSHESQLHSENPINASISLSESLLSSGISVTSEANHKCMGLAAQFFMFRYDSDSSSDLEVHSDSDDSWFDYEEDNKSLCKSQEIVTDHAHKQIGRTSPNISIKKNLNLIDEDSDSIEFAHSPQFSVLKVDDSSLDFSLSPTDHKYQIDGNDEELDSSIVDLEEDNLKEVNERWLRYYPDACNQYQQDSVKMKSKKVLFAENLVSAEHIVGAEDRRGEWMSFAVDRERFGRVIQQCGEVISLILDQSHRDKIYERNRRLSAIIDNE